MKIKTLEIPQVDFPSGRGKINGIYKLVSKYQCLYCTNVFVEYGSDDPYDIVFDDINVLLMFYPSGNTYDAVVGHEYNGSDDFTYTITISQDDYVTIP